MDIWLIKNNTWKDTYYAGIDHKPTMWGDRSEAVEFYALEVANIIFILYELKTAGCVLVRAKPRRVEQACDVCGGHIQKLVNRAVCDRCGEAYHRGI